MTEKKIHQSNKAVESRGVGGGGGGNELRFNFSEKQAASNPT